ncbi:LuxR C-terminal-related transcriptional regulator [Amycolatopsis magusensis]|uniref:LuxR C-terminal-related transcriptional regulator n=1 Tax=Amycolatopsis magusensis TaxID=882444 RepID=UPI00379432B4
MVRTWPLTGRAEELRFIETASRRADRPRGVVLAGAPGVGKTRLAREALAMLATRGAAVRWVTGTASARALPLGAFAGILGDVDPTPTRLVSAAIKAFVAGAPPAGLVIGVDDAHLLDELSALVVRELVLSGTAPLVLTMRSGEPAPDAVTTLWKDGYLDRLEVQPLSAPETAELLEAVLGGPVDSGATSRLWALTRGNALFLRQLVDGELEAGQLREAGGGWHWSGRLAVSAGLAELVHTRMGRLPDPLVDVVDVLALGEPLGVRILAGLTSASDVEQAEQRGLVELQRDGHRWNARLAHPLYGEVRRPGIGQLRARRLRGEIATALADTGGCRADDTLRRAALIVDSDIPPDPQLLTIAARDAIRLLDVGLSEQLARAAVDASGGFEAHLTLGMALSWLNRGADSEREFELMAERAENEQERLTLSIPRAANLFWPGRSPEKAEAVLDAVETSGEGQHLVNGARAAFHAFRARTRLALDTATETLASPGLPAVGALLATYGATIALGALGRADEIRPIAARAYATVSQSFATAVGTFGLCDIHTMALHVAGYLDEMDELADRHYRRAADMPGYSRLRGVSLRGQAARCRGRLRTAIADLREAQAGFAGVDEEGFAFRCLMNLTHALAMSGDAPAARKALAELEAERHPSFVFCDPDLLSARAWVAAAEGAVTEAVRLVREAASLAASRGQPAYEALALHHAVRFGDRTVAARLAELASTVDGPRASAAAAHAAALAEDDGAALLAAADQLERMGDLPAAADAAAHAVTAFARHDSRTAAQTAAARAHRLAERSEGARTPALAAAARPLPLTEREREIVTLAAEGLSNRAIADRLVVSVRTVEGHLYRAAAKLGTSVRTEFAALLHGD